MTRLECWAGLECTVNRVGDRYFDQIARSGHDGRLGDLDTFAALGISALRYPALWERIAPDGLSQARWAWTDERLARLRALGVRPILGLVHHGSGPRDTSLVDSKFGPRLAAYARAVAARYPWVEDFTPVNEPLTTARFACLYGHWYPHTRDLRAFVAALLGQCRATALAMRAIREVTPTARLIQTEDVGRIFGTPALAAQVDYQNHRRWLSLDLLCGRVDRAHPLWRHLVECGATERELMEFVDTPEAPDVIGLNYYVTSDRFLDERVDEYPGWARGGNGRQTYADVEAFRAGSCEEPARGWRARLEEAWERYRIPVAVTEAHLGGGRDEQLRWLAAAWEAARAVRADGGDVRAVTAWSLLGTWDWNQLVVREAQFYEPGIFDIRAPRPRPTALAKAVRGFATDGTFHHPVLETCGWWERDDARIYAPHAQRTAVRRAPSGRPILITGATGTLGRAFARVCESRGLAYRLLTRTDMDIADTTSVVAAIERVRPWAIVNTAGYVRVDDAESDPRCCARENTTGPAVLAAACAARGIPLVTFSSDLVFDGSATQPYVECDTPAPLSVYGVTKADAERAVLAVHPDALVIRTSAFFSPWDSYNFLHAALTALREGRRLLAPMDSTVSPTYVPDLVMATLDLLVDDEHGLWHLANAGAVTWAEFARQGARTSGVATTLIEECETAAQGFAAKRPRYSVLGSERGLLLPTLESAIGRFADARAATA